MDACPRINPPGSTEEPVDRTTAFPIDGRYSISEAKIMPSLSPRRAQLAGFEHAYAVALQRRRHSGVCQFIIETGNPMQPFRTSSRTPGNEETILALVA